MTVQSRWVDVRRPSSAMNHLMKHVHSGVSGNPLDKAVIASAVNKPFVLVRSKPPECAHEKYKVLGRANPLSLGAADEAAFEHLEQLLQPLPDKPRPTSAARAHKPDTQRKSVRPKPDTTDAKIIERRRTPASRC